MKKFLTLAITLVLIAGTMFAAVGCGNGTSGGGTTGEVKGSLMEGVAVSTTLSPEETEEALSGRGGDYLANFSVGLMKAGIKENQGNLLISPLSVAYAISMTTNGAEGTTVEELLIALMEGKYSGEAFSGTGSTGEGDIFDEAMKDMNEYLRAYMNHVEQTYESDVELLEQYSDRSTNTPSQFHIANSIWMKEDENLTVNPEFLETNGTYYDAGIFERTFDDTTLKDINGWIEDNTAGLIKDMLKEIPEDAIMYLVNALSFDGQWASTFEDYQLREDVFHGEQGDTDGITFMNDMDDIYLEDEKATGFMKPYQRGSYAFVGLLPNEGVTVDEYIESLNGADLRDMLQNPIYHDVIYSMPKFTEKSDLSLVNTFKTMGVTTPFNSKAADFSKLGTYQDQNIFIGNILHSTYIDVDQDGTKAGAATVVEMVAEGAVDFSEPPKEVILDRPFVYMIVDTNQGMPIFIGVIRDLQG